jgi:hypothetical protein
MGEQSVKTDSGDGKILEDQEGRMKIILKCIFKK